MKLWWIFMMLLSLCLLVMQGNYLLCNCFTLPPPWTLRGGGWGDDTHDKKRSEEKIWKGTSEEYSFTKMLQIKSYFTFNEVDSLWKLMEIIWKTLEVHHYLILIFFGDTCIFQVWHMKWHIWVRSRWFLLVWSDNGHFLSKESLKIYFLLYCLLVEKGK